MYTIHIYPIYLLLFIVVSNESVIVKEFLFFSCWYSPWNVEFWFIYILFPLLYSLVLFCCEFHPINLLYRPFFLEIANRQGGYEKITFRLNNFHIFCIVLESEKWSENLLYFFVLLENLLWWKMEKFLKWKR